MKKKLAVQAGLAAHLDGKKIVYGTSSWKEVWQKNMARWRESSGSKIKAVDSLSNVELQPDSSDGLPKPYEGARQIDKSGAIAANFADGQSERVSPKTKEQLVKLKAAGGTNQMIKEKFKKGWGQTWAKNMKAWRTALDANEDQKPSVSGMLSNAASQPDGDDAAPYPTGLATDTISKAGADKAPFN